MTEIVAGQPLQWYNERDENVFFSIVIEHDADGYVASCPSLQGCYTQGESYEEVIANINDAIKLHLEDREEEREQISPPPALSISTVSVTLGD
ncbi:type II toxin-antitoxin system HicB family antitoxin [Candidatus Peregrinibacteria bacterium]|nr:type II toxin-antitoxin system HicB family antitoxin [Candidatus Peregrinibacteria bacterium]MBI3815969.1 type II toxin-antitoxin system HicB family antitoxin [Candidatus Peregrinibacteria bacterium]